MNIEANCSVRITVYPTKKGIKCIVWQVTQRQYSAASKLKHPIDTGQIRPIYDNNTNFNSINTAPT